MKNLSRAQLASGRKAVWLLLLGLVLAGILLSGFSGQIVGWLWLRQLGYEQVFWRVLLLRIGLFGGSGAVVFLYAWLNLRYCGRILFPASDRPGPREIQLYGTEQPVRIAPGVLSTAFLLFALLLALLFGLIWAEEWNTLLRFVWAGDFGRLDPVYQHDIGFYLFRLPFYNLLQDSLVGLALLVLVGVLISYLMTGALGFGPGRSPANPGAWRHASVLFLLFLAFWGWGYYLDRFELLYSSSGVVFGAGYTDLHVVKTALWIMLGATVLLGAATITGLRAKRPLITLGGTGLYVLFGLLLLQVLPGLIQSFVVEPNELEKEKQYLEYNIAFTRQAFGLDGFQVQDYPGATDLTWQKLQDNQATLRNIRLWDWRPLLQTYRQMQEIRSYYKFYEVDVERYHLGPDYRQVMASARELAEDLPSRADTWVNRTLQFTHGYGLVMSLASQENQEGVPSFLVKDLPPASIPALEVTRPAVFYGEAMPGYKIVDTKVKELDYPKGDKNVYTSYQGRGGIPLDSSWKRLLFAWELSDINILLTSYVTPASRIQLWRRVKERVAKVAPFLRLDNDPYVVLSQGRLYWIQDLYTTSSFYPYSERIQGINYIRNSVKAVVDAYQGTVDFYVVDPADPVLQVYRRAFPGLFKELHELSPDLRGHLRYPLDLFALQVAMYSQYHMTIPQVFYNNEDRWTLAKEKYAGNPIVMEPYYILIRLPREKELEFLLMTPLTPVNRDNMIAWMAARCDAPHYGQVIVYKLPKEKLIYGPLQVEAMIDQDTLVSRRLSLWDQRGSRVIRGNLLVIPLDHSFLYVEPMYLIAEETDIPQLRQVIVAYNERVVMEDTLEGALRAAFGQAEPTEPARPTAGGPALRPETEKIRQLMQQAEQALQGGNWAEFGRHMEQLKNLLNQEK